MPFATVFQLPNLNPVLRKAFAVNAFAVPETIERFAIVPDVEVFPLKAILNGLAVQIA